MFRYRFVSLIWAIQFVNYLDRVCIAVAAPAMMSSLEIDAADMGLILSAFNVGYVLMQIPAACSPTGSEPEPFLSLVLWSSPSSQG